MTRAFLLLFFIITLPNHRLSPNHSSRLIIWNVGQGQWITASTSTHCLHFDIGGEQVSWQKINNECKQKKNRVYISHGDWDHISFLSTARYQWPHLCLAQPPQEKLTPTKEKLLSHIPNCQTLFKNLNALVLHPRTQSRSSNATSKIFVLNNRIIMSGDSPKSQEKLWRFQLPHPNKIRWMILGHHGSRTSTSKELLFYLPHLKQAIASARKAKYGHPHPQVEKILRDFNIPLLRTEEWGNIWLRLPEDN